MWKFLHLPQNGIFIADLLVSESKQDSHIAFTKHNLD